MVANRGIVAVQRPTAAAALALALAIVAGASVAHSADDPHTFESANLAHASFGSVEIGVNAPAISPKATDLFHRSDREAEAYSGCDGEDAACPPEVRDWRASLARMDGLAGLDLLSAVNTAVNARITYRDDRDAYGKVDHWATPGEALTSYGDCEDYAFVKYLSLIELGIPHAQMRIVIVKDTARDIGHAVLAVTLDNGTFVLDNVVAEPVPDSALAHYQPIYSFNMDQQWLNVAVRLRTEQVAANDVAPSPVSVVPPAARQAN